MEIKTVRIDAGKGYDVLIGEGLLEKTGEIIRGLAEGKAAVITDDRVSGLYLDALKESLEKSGFRVISFAIENGEKSKNISTLSDILEFLAQSGITRSDIIIALGGGVVGDIAGFAAGVYLRGIRFVQIPTTFLAAIDSSVGGKTAVNLEMGKNLAGVFKQPEAVICDINTLRSLEENIFADGTAEAIKAAILKDRELFELISESDIKKHLTEIIAGCVEIKAEYVRKDEFDKGERQFLNLGHTFAHTIEKKSGYRISHGHAVAMGLALAAKTGEKLGTTENGVYEKVVSCLMANNLPFASPYKTEELWEIALTDKKRKGDTMTFVLIEKIGKCILKEIPIKQAESVFCLGDK